MTDSVVDLPARRGKTESQLRGAPRGAIYVWHSQGLMYPKRMARWIGRDDLLMVAPYHVSSEMLAAQGRPVVVDHGAILPVELLDVIDVHNKEIDVSTTASRLARCEADFVNPALADSQ
jgi:hypothetical protein